MEAFVDLERRVHATMQRLASVDAKEKFWKVLGDADEQRDLSAQVEEEEQQEQKSSSSKADDPSRATQRRFVSTKLATLRKMSPKL
uniref:Uncharacterized protein n=1 Tax=Plectus sambesii TaxID=2011161 RepID=A0A914UYM4_9BILA